MILLPPDSIWRPAPNPVRGVTDVEFRPIDGGRDFLGEVSLPEEAPDSEPEIATYRSCSGGFGADFRCLSAAEIPSRYSRSMRPLLP
jgi:hypothetical protein